MATQAPHGKIRLWRFFDYVDPISGKSVITPWLALRPGRHAELDVVLKLLAITPGEKWRPPLFKWLTDVPANVGLGELRFRCQGVEQRPAGCLGRSPGEFVLLIGCEKRGTAYTPSAPHPFDVAQTRMTRYQKGQASIVERVI